MIRRRLGFELVLVGLFVALGAVTWDLSDVLSMQETGHHHDEGAVLAHNAAATVVVVVGVLLAALGARMLLSERPVSRNAHLLFLASTLMFADGVLHFYVVSEHLSILPFAVFFVAAGAVQLGLGFGLFRERPNVYLLSVVVTVGLILLFFITRAIAVPFSEGPEELEALGILSKVLELVTLGALGLLVYRWRASSKAATTPPDVS
jgi:uncharacterized membrane protein